MCEWERDGNVAIHVAFDCFDLCETVRVDLVSIAHHANFGCDMQGLNALEVKVGITS
jgi:hypothetical protein